MDKLKKHFKRIVIFIIIYILLDILTFNIMKTVYKKKEVKESLSTPKVEVTEFKTTVTNGYINGKVTNNTGAALEGKALKMDFFSKNGSNVGTKLVDLSELAADQTSDFATKFNFDNVENVAFSIINKSELNSEQMNWFNWDDIKNRYEDLRSRGILTPEHIMQYINDWYNRVGGEETYNSEKQRWPDSYCYNELICNPNWTTTEDWTGYRDIADYDASVTYNEGDTCKLSYRIWIATGTTTGVKPYSKLGYSTPDNASRVQTWISDRLALEDSYLGYTRVPEDTPTPIDGIVLSESNMEIESIYNASGIPIKNMKSGLNIVRYKNGETKKVFNK